jgi:hypothetical protein
MSKHVIDAFIHSHDLLHASSHLNSSLNSLHINVALLAKSLKYYRSKHVAPRNLLISMMLIGTSIVIMVGIIYASTNSPSLQIICPSNTPKLTQKTHFSELRLIPLT